MCTVCGGRTGLEEEKAKRLSAALLSNLDTWVSDLEAIVELADPGNRLQSLHLLRNMAQAKQALIRLSSPL